MVFVPPQTGPGGRRFSPNSARSEAVEDGLPGLADGANGDLEKGALRAQDNERRPRSCLRPHTGSMVLQLR